MSSLAYSALHALASRGLFPRDPEKTRNAIQNNSCFHIDTSDLCELPFQIRLAKPEDIEELFDLEIETWPDESLRATRDTINQRITCIDSSAESFVAVNDSGKVFAAIYTQRIMSIDCLTREETCHANQETLRTRDGSVLQLISVSSRASVAHLQAGSILRYFVLLSATADPSINLVTAMTRCSQFMGNYEEEYLKYVFEYDENSRHPDPTLSFHLSAHAKIHKVMAKFRPADKINLGNSVNIQYDIKSNLLSDSNPTGSHIGVIDMVELKKLISNILPSSNTIPVDISDIPFMDIGFDSLTLIELGLEIKKMIQDDGRLSATFLFDYPTPRVLLLFLNRKTTSSSISACHTNSKNKFNDYLGVVGLSCRFPDANSPEIFFDNLCFKKNSVQKVPESWIESDKSSCRYAAFLDEKSSQYFDPTFYGLSDVEASCMDPHHRLLLDLCFDALLSAELLQPTMSDGVLDRASCFKPVTKNIGVFIGLSNTDYLWSEASSYKSQSNSRSFAGVNSAMSSAANRISHIFGLTGPSLVIDTACSSSISALHVASMSLLCGQCDACLVASADLLISKHSLEIRDWAHMLAPDGSCKVFDSDANGYVRGEGGGAVVLQRLKDAEERHRNLECNIHGVIRSVVLNHNGTSVAYTAPNGASQSELLATAVKQAGITADDTIFIETHGTGTKLGDPVEWAAINEVYLMHRDPSIKSIIIGAVKSNIGHLEASAGIAGLIKTLFVLKNLVAPPNLHLRTLNPLVVNDPKRAIFPQEITAISRGRFGVFAGLSSFGSGGANAHAILQRYEGEKEETISIKNPKHHTKQRRCFMFTGQTSVYSNMAIELFRSDDVFRTTVNRCSDYLQLNPSLVSQLYPDNSVDDESLLIKNAVYCQCGTVVVELALFNSLIARGVAPSAVIGHSLGEIVACVAAGLLSEESCLILTRKRAECILTASLSCASSDTCMAAVRVSYEDVERTIQLSHTEGFLSSNSIVVAAINGPNNTVISGSKSSIDFVCHKLGKPYKILNTTHAFHSPFMEEAAMALQGSTNKDLWSSLHCVPSLSFYSTLHGSRIDKLSTSHWIDHMLRPVLFLPAIKAIVESESISTFIEIGPDSTLSQLGPQCVVGCIDRNKVNDIKWLNCLSRETSSILTLNSVVRFQRSIKKNPKYLPWRVIDRSVIDRGDMKTLHGRYFDKSMEKIDQFTSMSAESIRSVIVNLLPSVTDLEVGNDTSLIKLGLDSLHLFELRHRLLDITNLTTLPVSVVLQNPTINSIMSFLNKEIQKKALVEKEGLTCFPITSMQRGLLFKCAQNPSTYIEKFKWIAKDFNGEIFNVDRFCQAFSCLIARHESLRSSFEFKTLEDIQQQVWSIGLPAFHRENWLEHIVKCDNPDELFQANDNFDFNRPPLFRIKIIELDSYCLVYFFIHHLIIDGWSINVLVRDLLFFYDNLQCGSRSMPEGLPLSSPFSSFASADAIKPDDKSFWLKKINVPVLRSRRLALVEGKASRAKRCIAKDDAAVLLRFSRNMEVSIGCVFHTIWALVLTSLCSSEISLEDMKSVVYGYTSSGRSANINGIQSIVGPTINTLPMIINFDPQCISLLDLLQHINFMLINNVEHERFPLTNIIGLHAGYLGTSELFQTLFDFQYINWSTPLLEFQDFTDLIGYPLSFRILCKSDDIIFMNIVSECELNSDHLESILNLFERCLQQLLSMNDDSLKATSWKHFVLKDLSTDIFTNGLNIDNAHVSTKTRKSSESISSDLDTTGENLHEDSEEFLVFVEYVCTLLQDIWALVLNISISRIDMNSNFFSLGGSSLLSMQIVSQCLKHGISMRITDVFLFPVLKDIAKQIALKHKLLGPTIIGTHGEGMLSNAPFQVDDHIISDTDPKHGYPLIGINKAHFVGLYTSGYSNVSIVPQIYFEWKIDSLDGKAQRLNVDIFNLSLNLFVQRHVVFQSFCGEDGIMQIKQERPFYYIQVFDVSEQLIDKQLDSIRKHMIESNLNPHLWPLFEICVTHTGELSSLLHVRVSLFLMDAMGDLIFRQEISDMYNAGIRYYDSNTMSLSAVEWKILEALPSIPKLQFNHYSNAHELYLYTSSQYQESWVFWKNRLSSLPIGSEQLPLLPGTHPNYHPNGQFVNMSTWLTASEWKQLQSNCRIRGITVPVALLTIYALAISRWSGRNHFLVNVLQCLRHQVHEDANRMVGNCSATLLCEVDFRNNSRNVCPSFLECAKRIALELAQNLQHCIVSGVEVMQELNRRNGTTFSTVVPFIFTSPIGVETGNVDVSRREWFFEETFFSEKVPHAACVNAVKEYKNGTACASLDIVDGIFPVEVISGFSESYKSLVKILVSKDNSAWSNTLVTILGDPLVSVPLSRPLMCPKLLLHDGFLNNASYKGDSNALMFISAEDESTKRFSLTYNELDKMARLLSISILESILRNGTTRTTVAVVMEKGWEQIVSVLGILMADCHYLPIDSRLWPSKRVWDVIERSGAALVLSQIDLECHSYSVSIPIFNVTKYFENKPGKVIDDKFRSFTNRQSILDDESIAYLIYTSGSTGIPKGVACHHKGAVNTIFDINERYSICGSDKVLALSSLSFDLSVYDIFGLFYAGGSVILPAIDYVYPPDPLIWLNILNTEGVTIWNTVPAYMELLVSCCEIYDEKISASLRLVLLSGDRIPVSLARRIRGACLNTQVRIVSLGGATEAAIWSNIYEFSFDSIGSGDGIPDEWGSVPYGKPLRNQTMYILDESFNNCEPWVIGEIFIGGVGVANGYHGDEEKTLNQFILHPITKERLFRTYDLGRIRIFNGSGLLEILGRKDSQVKVNGFRIELGEVEQTFQKHMNVQSVAVKVHENALYAYLVPVKTLKQSVNYFIDDVNDWCRENLPDYMIPNRIIVLEELPLSPNGKVLRENLHPPIEDCSACDPNRRIDDIEVFVRDLFSQILNAESTSNFSEISNFFTLGGTSVSAIQLMYQIKKKYSVAVTVGELFSNPTIEGIANLVRNLIQVPRTIPNSVLMKSYKLSTGRCGDYVTLVMMNPAGTSGLCYLDLSKKLTKYDVYVIDDDVVASGNNFPYRDINQVVDAVFAELLYLADRINSRKIVLGGWSYGGLIAFLTALRFQDLGLKTDTLSIEVLSVILIDSPLSLDTDRKRDDLEYKVPDSLSEFVVERSRAHFTDCTTLIVSYHKEQSLLQDGEKLLHVPIIEFRPLATFSNSSKDSHKTNSRSVTHDIHYTPGNHWTMIFGEHAAYISDILNSNVPVSLQQHSNL